LQLTYTVQATDGHATSNQQTVTITITGTDDAPVIGGTGNTISYVAETTAKVIDSALTVADVDNQNLAGATVTISNGFQTGDVLAATTTGTSITAIYSATTHTLTLTGSDTLANYQQVLESVTFQNATNNNTSTRTITWQVSDGTLNSNTGTTTINVTATFDIIIGDNQTVSENNVNNKSVSMGSNDIVTFGG